MLWSDLMMLTYLYRIEHYEDPFTNDLSIHYERFAVTKVTARGYKIRVNGKEKFVLSGNGKRYAHENLEWALESYRRRKQHYVQNCKRRLKLAKACLTLAENAVVTELTQAYRGIW